VPRIRPGVALLLVGVVALGIVILVDAGWRGLAVYSFFVGMAAAVAFGARVGGDVVTGASRGRFERHDRH
jgi:hypothetical protein